MKITGSEISLVGATLVMLLVFVLIYSFPVWDVDVSRESILILLRVVVIALITALLLVKIPIELRDPSRGLAVALFGLGLVILLLMSVTEHVMGVGGKLSLAWFIMAPLLAFIVVVMIGLAAMRRSGATVTMAWWILALVSLLILASAVLMLLSTGLFVGLATLLLLVYCLRNVTHNTSRRPTQ